MSELHAIILAAGEGTRMKSQTPKVLHPAAGQTLIGWVLQAVRQAGVKSPLVVLGHKAEEVARVLPEDVRTALQAKRLGTGDAVAAAKRSLATARGEVLVLCGDAPHRVVPQVDHLTGSVVPCFLGCVLRAAPGKAFAWLTHHAAAPDRLPDWLRNRLPDDLRGKRSVYARDVGERELELVWRLHREALAPLVEAGKLGAVLFQF
ncbi:MAG: NTP transferase domain-containing protein, partial [Candidatus Firestonebacteria bacterium]|nr:NTP transferase domain-containing protein [Candidatus Firestonebacteria bacterium]